MTWSRPAAIVIGADELGSAIAVALDRAGYAVVVCDAVDPPWPRRGMAFTDAWYYGNATLDGATAVFCATVKSIPSLLERPRVIAATTWSWSGTALALPTAAIVAATPGPRRPPLDLLTRAHGRARTIGIGAHYAAGRNADIAIGGAEGKEPRNGSAAPASPADASLSLEPVWSAPTVSAPVAGRFATASRIGDAVHEGEVVGVVGAVPIVAPGRGVLVGLSARGAAVRPGDTIVEVDPRGDPARCFGPHARAAAIALEVVAALGAGESGAARTPSGRERDPLPVG